MLPITTTALERAWTITEALHRMLTAAGPTDWPAVADLAGELRGLSAEAESPGDG